MVEQGKKPLRVLMVEDSEDDALLLLRALERGGYDAAWERVDRPEAMRAALIRSPFDVVFAGHSLPHFDSHAALRLLRETGIDIPFLVVSGSIPEESAVALMREGAHDFVLKQNLARLVPAVEREVREAAVRAANRRAERDLRASEERYRGFFEHDLTGVVFTEPRGRILACNPSFARMFGYTSPVAAQGADVRLHWTDAGARERLLQRLRQERSVEGFEGEFRRVDGAAVQIVANVVADFAEDGSLAGITTYVFDLTDRHRLEAQFRQAQKMEAVGRLAGGVAHDFNNLLTAVNGYAEMAIAALAESDPVHRYVSEIRKAGERAAVLTRRLLGFSRKEATRREVLDLNAVLRETEGMLLLLIGEDVTLRMFFDAALGPVMADRGQVEQIVMNFVVNARDAMPCGGSLLVQTVDATSAAAGAGPDADLAPGRYARVSVSDTGTGMTPEVQARLFEPFFTTKEIGKGTGLGLAIVKAIVEENAGHVRFTSAPGKGTEFRVYIPVVEGLKPVEPAPVPALEATRGSETVLLVEDDSMVRDFCCDVLKAAGYAVLDARDGHAAMRVAESHAGPIDLLVTDVVLPGMNGRDVAAQVAALRPQTRVLFLSGYTREALLDHGMTAGDVGAGFLQKPFRARELTARVRDVLGRVS